MQNKKSKKASCTMNF